MKESNKLKIIKIGLVAAGLMIAKEHWKRKKVVKRLRKGNRFRDRASVLDEINSLPHYIYQRMFRVDRSTFEELLGKVNAHIGAQETNELMAKRQVSGHRGQPVSNRIKLHCALRFLAGGSYWDICFGFKVGFGSFFSDSKFGIIWPIMEAIDASYKIGLKMTDREEMEKQAAEFAAISEYSQEVFNGVVMAIDGLIIKLIGTQI